ncbi:AI-2E family transporter [Convivina praedatoris]|uniref:AI-2E family transporter n=1 Tax=Convivina praedatoris TaxID=2880963 RepID=A0ABN8HFR3_9LACO|nr:AI-2E family transporter [Convivina sp. LMG 32447]CAH1856034.1 hypothetical protein R078138_01248 [Convivina sp. LMG 32447]CAH1856256.1 hypothetical protein R077815_01362 [Convivina sp. LMG 32447]CAH1857119.1 hypothetical protein LMG032447_01449 [Convivina sp. LMG 32447]
MFPNKKSKKLFFWTIELLALALLLYVVLRFDFVMHPVSVFISTVFMPLLISGFLYYLLKPLLKLIEKVRIKSWMISHNLAVILTFLVFLFVVIGACLIFVPIIINEITNLINSVPSFIRQGREITDQLMHSHWFKRLNITVSEDDLKNSINQYASSAVSITAGTLKNVIVTTTTVTLNILTVPIILFYMLSDGDRLIPAIQKFFSDRHNDQIAELAGQMDQTIERYISGQAIQMVFVGLSMSLGYWIAGLPYIWLLGLIAGIANIVPYVGPGIGVIPALILAIPLSWKAVIIVLVAMAVVQQITGSIIYPAVLGKSLQIHPLTIMLLLLGAGNLWGIVGMILVVPVYAISRTIVLYVVAMRNIDKL